jgi:hypothetical protein
MSNGHILDLKGKPLNDTASEHKRSHDSDRVNGIRNHLSQLLGQMKKSWAQDMSSDPQGATSPNVAAIRQHWNEKWVAQAVAVMNSTEPVEVDPEALDKWIAQQLENNARNRQMATPLHVLADLEPQGFKLLGLYHEDPVWVSTEVAVRLIQGGAVEVWVRPQSCGSLWPAELPKLFTTMEPDAILPDYTLGELHNLLLSLRRQEWKQPSEEVMAQAREALNATVKP